jgi:hypothetical protein
MLISMNWACGNPKVSCFQPGGVPSGGDAFSLQNHQQVTHCDTPAFSFHQKVSERLLSPLLFSKTMKLLWLCLSHTTSCNDWWQVLISCHHPSEKASPSSSRKSRQCKLLQDGDGDRKMRTKQKPILSPHSLSTQWARLTARALQRHVKPFTHSSAFEQISVCIKYLRNEISDNA